MALSDSYRNDLARLKEKEAALRREVNRHESDRARATEEEQRNRISAMRASSASSRNSYFNAAVRAQKKAVEAGRKAAEASQKLGQNSKDQANKARSLHSAERSEQRAADRESDRRRRQDRNHAHDIARLSAPRVHHVYLRAPEPEKLRVLYLTANPQLDLRTEAEVRHVQQALRSAKYRELVDIQQRPAASFQDLLDGLNDVRPHIVHFSGHADGQAVQFDTGQLDPNAGHLVDFRLLVEALAATDEPPALLVLNACNTLAGALPVLLTVPVIIGMSNAVPDLAAIVFAQQFYAAIASSQSVGAALRQARVSIKAVLLDEGADALPQHVTRDDIDIDNLVLVRALRNDM